jgi:SAM-dependent methyltransferase
MDRDRTAVEQAQERVPAGDFRVVTVPPIPAGDHSFDVGVSFETLEHIADEHEFVSELRRVIRPGGRLLISSPNRAYWSPNDAVPPSPYHIREYLLPDLIALLQASGFEDLEVWYQRRERIRVHEILMSAVIGHAPSLCKPGRWWDRIAHGTGDVLRWSAEIALPQFWVLDCR